MLNEMEIELDNPNSLPETQKQKIWMFIFYNEKT